MITRNRLLILAAVLFAGFVIYRQFFYVNIVNETPTGTSIIAFGDSLTAGTGASQGEDYPTQLSRLCGCEIINRGVPGETTAHALERLEEEVLNADPRIVILFLGGNDLLQRLPYSETFTNLETMITRIQAKGALVILVGIKGLFFTDSYGGKYRELARKKGAVLVHDALSGIISSPKLKGDQVHPNGAGYKLVAERVWAKLKRYTK